MISDMAADCSPHQRVLSHAGYAEMIVDRISYAIPAEFLAVRGVAIELRAVLGSFGCTEDQVQLLELAAVEAMNNVVEHAYGGLGAGELEVTVCRDEQELELRFVDRGVAMARDELDRARAPRADASRPEGGYGLGLMLQIATDVRYESSAGTNTLVLRAGLVPKTAP